MLKNRNLLNNVSPALCSGLIAAAVALMPLTEAVAGGPTMTTTTSTLPYVPGPVARFCDAAGIGEDYPRPPVNVRVIAGAVDMTSVNPDPFSPFPVAAFAPECPGGLDKCLRWDYRWIYSSAGYIALPPAPTYAVVAVDADVNVPGVSPTTPAPAVITAVRGDPVTGYGQNKASEIGLRFPSSGATFFASFYTPSGVGVGTMTAGFSAGSRRGYCAIAGADNPTVIDPVLSTPKTVNTTHNFTRGTCLAKWTQSPDGCVTAVEIVQPGSDPNCTTTPFQAFVSANNKPIAAATCGTEVGGETGSTQTCKWNSMLRTFTCVSLPSL